MTINLIYMHFHNINYISFHLLKYNFLNTIFNMNWDYDLSL